MKKRTIFTGVGAILLSALALTGCSSNGTKSLEDHIPAKGMVSFELNGFDSYLKTDGWDVKDVKSGPANTFMADKAQFGCNIYITGVENDIHVEKNESDDYMSKKFLYENSAARLQSDIEPQENVLPKVHKNVMNSNVGKIQVYAIDYNAPEIGITGGETPESPTVPSGETVGTVEVKSSARFFNSNYENEAGYKAGSGFYASMSCSEGAFKEGTWDKLLNTVTLKIKN